MFGAPGVTPGGYGGVGSGPITGAGGGMGYGGAQGSADMEALMKLWQTHPQNANTLLWSGQGSPYIPASGGGGWGYTGNPANMQAGGSGNLGLYGVQNPATLMQTGDWKYYNPWEQAPWLQPLGGGQPTGEYQATTAPAAGGAPSQTSEGGLNIPTDKFSRSWSTSTQGLTGDAYTNALSAANKLQGGIQGDQWANPMWTPMKEALGNLGNSYSFIDQLTNANIGRMQGDYQRSLGQGFNAAIRGAMGPSAARGMYGGGVGGAAASGIATQLAQQLGQSYLGNESNALLQALQQKAAIPGQIASAQTAATGMVSQNQQAQMQAYNALIEALRQSSASAGSESPLEPYQLMASLI